MLMTKKSTTNEKNRWTAPTQQTLAGSIQVTSEVLYLIPECCRGHCAGASVLFLFMYLLIHYALCIMYVFIQVICNELDST
jgi:hypothetical protein